ncbi:MAG TPA: hypothetical protein VGB37_17470 [Candidatus Lokiarchaeia archaeon]
MNLGQITEKIRNFTDFRGYVLYIFDSEKLEGKLYPLPRIQPTLRIRETSEDFALGKPAFYIEGKPVFIVYREYPVSISLETKIIEESGYYCKECSIMFDNEVKNCEKCGKEVEILKFKPHLAEKGYSASEINAKVTSIYTNRIFRQSAITSTFIIVFILSIILSILVTVLTLNMIWQAKIDDLVKSSEIVVSFLKIGGLL